MTVTSPVEAPELAFAVEEVAPVTDAVTPLLRFRVRIEATGPVRSLALNVQLRLDATRRRYAAGDERLLSELFGGRERWGMTLRSLQWLTVSTTVPRFTGATTVDVLAPATYDFEIVAAKYLNALPRGDVPVELLFSGTLFYAASDGRLQAAPLSWEHEARTSLPVAVWREALDAAFPGCAWLRLDRDAFDRLWAFRADRALPSWEATVDELLGDRI